MGRLVGVVGKSGSGKTTALRNMPPKETVLVLPNQKTQLPFPGSRKNYVKYNKDTKSGNVIVTSTLNHLPSIIEEVASLSNVKYMVIEDFTHFFNARTQSDEFRNKTSGNAAFKKWADLAADVFNSVFRTGDLREDFTLILHFHPEEVETMEGVKYQIKTPGKLLDRDIDIPSYFTYLIYTKVLAPHKDVGQSDRYRYVTNDDGMRPAKSPMGCLDLEMENDLYKVLQAIDKYENGE